MSWRLQLGLVLVVLYAAIPVSADNESKQIISAQAPQFQNADEYRKSSGLDKYYQRASTTPLHVAIIDVGFAELETLQGWLPANIRKPVEIYPKDLVEDPEFAQLNLGNANEATPFVPAENHGTLSAHLLWSLLGKPTEGYDFHFLNGNGSRNLKRAAAYCKKNGIKVALVALTQDSGGKRDGHGYINNAFTYAAVQGGVIFLVTAGNKGNMVRHITADRVSKEGYFEIDSTGRIGMRIRSNLKTNPVILTVSWTGYGKDEFDIADKDVDVLVRNYQNRDFAYSNFRQGFAPPQAAKVVPPPPLPESELKDAELTGPQLPQLVPPSPTPPAEQKKPAGKPVQPFEELKLTLDKNAPGEYYKLYLKKYGGTFDANDTITITVRPLKGAMATDAEGRAVPSVEFLDAKRDREIPVLADNPNMITIGDVTPLSARGGALGVPNKPDVLSPASTAKFDESEYYGNSVSYIFTAAEIIAMVQQRPELTRQQIMKWIESLPVEKISGAQAENAKAPAAQWEDLQKLEWKRLLESSEYHQELVHAIEQMGGERPVVAYFNRDNGRVLYGLSYTQNALAPFQKFSLESLPQFQFFVRRIVRQDGEYIEGRPRLKDRFNQNQPEPYPWERPNGGDVSEWVELRTAVAENALTATSDDVWEGRIWKLPSLEQLHKL